MKEIKAIVQTPKLQKIHDAFHRAPGFPGISAIRADWFGSHADRPKTPKEELTDFAKKTLITLLAPDELVDQIVKIIVDCAYTGQPGDGLIWVTPVEQAIRIRDARGKTDAETR
ncbi:MAG TPA: P-II family nitrogen regulator [Candidatus Methylomirabilis sp.]|nr:P-II family nitrogen regulator [Candidatus Methylomirabilis sp.]